MTYLATAAAKSGQKPLWLYQFEFGDQVVRYASSAASRVVDVGQGAEIWAGSAVRHSDLSQTLEVSRAEVQLLLPRWYQIGQDIRDDRGRTPAKVILWHGFLNDPDLEFVPKFRGRVVGVAPGIVVNTLICENRFTAHRNGALSPVIQRPCRHVHYGTGCQLNITDFQVDATVTALVGNVATVADAASEPDGTYKIGSLEFNGVEVDIREHAGTSLTLEGNLTSLADEIATNGSATVKIAPGCPRTKAVCLGRFDNIINFGGVDISETLFDGRRVGPTG